jgi:hypothetical protein
MAAGGEAQQAQSIGRPAFGGRRTFLRRLGRDQQTPHPQEWGGALGDNRGSGKRPGDDEVVPTTLRVVTPDLFRPPADDADPVGEPELGDRLLQERGPPLAGVEQDQFGLRPPQGEDETGEPGAGAEVQRQRGTPRVAIRDGKTSGVLNVRPYGPRSQETDVPGLDEDVLEQRCRPGHSRRSAVRPAPTTSVEEAGAGHDPAGTGKVMTVASTAVAVSSPER